MATPASSTTTRMRPQPELADGADALDVVERVDVERARGLDLDDLAARRPAAQGVGRVEGDQAPAGDQRDQVARLGLGDVLGRDEERAPGIAQAAKLGPDLGSQQRIDADGGLVEDEELGVVDERRTRAPRVAASRPTGCAQTRFGRG